MPDLHDERQRWRSLTKRMNSPGSSVLVEQGCDSFGSAYNMYQQYII